MKSLLLIVMIIISFQGVSQNVSGKHGVNVHEKRINKVREYYENGQLKVKGREKGKKEWVGCLGRRMVYKKTGRWKYYNNQGYLMKVVKYKDDNEIKVIYVVNKR